MPMADLQTIAGLTPGLLDSTQPQRVLRSVNATLSFAEYNGGPVPPQVSESLEQIFGALKSRRVVVETSPDGNSHWRFVPAAVLNGVPDEGHWPQVVNFLGRKTVMMTRDQWDLHKLDPAYTCTIDVNMASIWPAGTEHTTHTPISPPTTDSDIKQARPGVGTKSQPYVVDDPEKLSVPPSAPRPPLQCKSDAKPNPFAARVGSLPADDEDGEDSYPEHPATPKREDSIPKSAKRKSPCSPNDQERAHSVISISSDSGNETATPGPRKRSTSAGPFPDEAGPSTPRSKMPSTVRRASRFKRRRMHSTLEDPPIGLKSEPVDPTTAATPSVPAAPRASPSFVRSPGVPPSAKRPRPTSRSPDSPAHKRPRFHTNPTHQPSRDPAYSRAPNAPPIRIFLQPRSSTSRPSRNQFPDSSASESESDVDAPPQRSHTLKRPASDSPEVEEISGPLPSNAKRQRMDDELSSRKPRAANKQERAQRRAEREKTRKAARPTASLFGGSFLYTQDILNAMHAEFAAGHPHAVPGGSYTAYRPVAADYPSFRHYGPAADAESSSQAGPHAHASSLPVESSSEVEVDEDEDKPEPASAALDDEEGDAGTGEDGNEHAAAIEESKRKLAELERDRPLWEAEERKRKNEEEFARRQAEAKKLREEQRRRDQAARDEARKREQQEWFWKRYEAQEKRRAEQARREAEARAHARRFEDFADFHSHWTYMYGAKPRSAHFAGASTSARQTWTPTDALARYEKQCAPFDASKYTDQDKLSLDTIPWPILARSPVSMDHVDWDTVGEFFKTIKSLMSTAEYTSLVDKSHKRWHPDRWRSRTGAFRFINGTDAQREQVEKKVNMVSQVITPLWQETR